MYEFMFLQKLVIIQRTEFSKEINTCILFFDDYFFCVQITHVHFRKLENINEPKSKKLVHDPQITFNIFIIKFKICLYVFIVLLK